MVTFRSPSRVSQRERPPLDPFRSAAGGLRARIGAMRAAGMSDTAIRRALGLSAAQALDAGIAVPSDNGPPDTASPRRHGPASASIATTAYPRGPKLSEVLEAVADVTGVSETQILGRGQTRCVARARQLVMLLLRELCAGASLPTIGFFLERDHTTVLYGCRRARALCERDALFHTWYRTARSALGHPPPAARNDPAAR